MKSTHASIWLAVLGLTAPACGPSFPTERAVAAIAPAQVPAARNALVDAQRAEVAIVVAEAELGLSSFYGPTQSASDLQAPSALPEVSEQHAERTARAYFEALDAVRFADSRFPDETPLEARTPERFPEYHALLALRDRLGVELAQLPAPLDVDLPALAACESVAEVTRAYRGWSRVELEYETWKLGRIWRFESARAHTRLADRGVCERRPVRAVWG